MFQLFVVELQLWDTGTKQPFYFCSQFCGKKFGWFISDVHGDSYGWNIHFQMFSSFMIFVLVHLATYLSFPLLTSNFLSVFLSFSFSLPFSPSPLSLLPSPSLSFSPSEVSQTLGLSPLLELLRAWLFLRRSR